MPRALINIIWLVLGLGALAALAAGIAESTLRREIAVYQSGRWPAPPLAAVVFYTDRQPEQTSRFALALELYRQKRVDKLLFVGGYRRTGAQPGAARLADKAIRILGRRDAAVADRRSFDTLSNLTSACRLQMEFAPGRGLILLSDPMHLARIWPQRSRLTCVAPDRVGYTMAPPPDGLFGRWRTVQVYGIASALYALLGEKLYATLIRWWRLSLGA